MAYDTHRVGKYPQHGPADWLDRIKAGLVDAADEWKPTEHFGQRCLEDEELPRQGPGQEQPQRGVEPGQGHQSGTEASTQPREASMTTEEAVRA
jgi:hypothetical protein